MRNTSIIIILISILTITYSCKPKTGSENVESAIDNSYYLKKGKEISQATFSVLSTNLQKAIKEGGISNALSYCNLAASPLVDSISNEYNTSVRRTSFLTRNNKNTPTDNERKILKRFSDQHIAGKELSPILVENKNVVSFYSPIKINNLCLQCHGIINHSLSRDNYDTIKKYYPNDQAIGYKDGDLRGMWSVSFKTSN